MKRAVATLVMVVASAAALALPSTKEVDAAISAGQWPQAEAMLREVIKERPKSARAHYELGEVLARERRYEDARKEFLEAQRLDPELRFAKNPQHFREQLNKLPASSTPTLTVPPAPTPAAPASVPHPRPQQPAGSSFPWGYLLLGGGVLVVIWMVLSRAFSANRQYSPAMGGAAGGAGYGGGYGPGYGVPPQGSGSGIGGAVLGGIAGMAAGYGLAKVLEHGHDTPPPQHAVDNGGYVPFDSNPQVDFGEFDTGTGGDSWGGDDSSSSDDNW